MKHKEQINPLRDNVLVEKNGRRYQLHWRNRYDPTTIGLTLFATGAGLSAYSTLEAGKQTAELGKIAQQQYEQDAKAAVEAGRYESLQKRKEGTRAKAKQIAQAFAQGGTLTGSKLEIIAETAEEFEADARVIMHNYQIEATRLRNIGAIERYKGQTARRASRIRAFSNLLSVGGKASTIYGLGSSSAPSYSSSYSRSASTGSGAYAGTRGGGPTGGYSRSIIY